MCTIALLAQGEFDILFFWVLRRRRHTTHISVDESFEIFFRSQFHFHSSHRIAQRRERCFSFTDYVMLFYYDLLLGRRLVTFERWESRGGVDWVKMRRLAGLDEVPICLKWVVARTFGDLFKFTIPWLDANRKTKKIWLDRIAWIA